MQQVREDCCGYASAFRQHLPAESFYKKMQQVREDCCGYASTITERWRRDERIPVKACEHTHFPHAILEVSTTSLCSYCMCVLLLLYVCPHTAVCVSSYCYACVLILLCMCPHAAMYVSSCCYVFVLILLHIYR
jgi:hypothetical protein